MTDKALALELTGQFRLALEAAPTGMLIVDRQGTVVFANAQIERIFGYTRDELVGGPVERLVPERFRPNHPDFRDGFFADPHTRPMGGGRDLYGRRKDASEVPVEIGLNPMSTNDGHFVIGSVIDITERKRAEREREALLEQMRALNQELEGRVSEREVLLAEVHHRVKNNLQVISSLINMQSRRLEGAAGRRALEACQTRIQAMALIHEKLYQAKNYASVPFSDYLRSLAESVFATAAPLQADITLEHDVVAAHLKLDKAIPCGLLINELLTNALKHAFVGRPKGNVHIELATVSPGTLRLGVSDDGRGLPSDLDWRDGASLGLQLVHTLAEQLGGEIDVDTGPGTSFRVTFRQES